jgi:predicted metal-dependent phosphoesterase TrpH
VPFRDRGSLWGRWDLHFHTPTSFDYKNASVTNEQIVEGLQKAGVSAVAITDHHVMFRVFARCRSSRDTNSRCFPGLSSGPNSEARRRCT